MDYSYLIIFKADPLAQGGLAMILFVSGNDESGNPLRSLQALFAFIWLAECLVMLDNTYLVCYLGSDTTVFKTDVRFCELWVRYK